LYFEKEQFTEILYKGLEYVCGTLTQL